jgi:hypothetical protein
MLGASFEKPDSLSKSRLRWFSQRAELQICYKKDALNAALTDGGGLQQQSAHDSPQRHTDSAVEQPPFVARVDADADHHLLEEKD